MNIFFLQITVFKKFGFEKKTHFCVLKIEVKVL